MCERLGRSILSDCNVCKEEQITVNLWCRWCRKSNYSGGYLVIMKEEEVAIKKLKNDKPPVKDENTGEVINGVGKSGSLVFQSCVVQRL